MKPVLKKSLEIGAGPAGLFATAVGFFCDFVKPYINLVPYFLIISTVIAIGIWFFFLRKHIKGDFDLDTLLSSGIGKIFASAILSTVFWLIMLPIFAITPERGYAATELPAISDWQEKLFGKLDKIDSKLDLVLTKIDQLDSGKGGVIASPKTPNEWYHNARIHELGGNTIEARKAYEAYFKSDLAYLDPFLSYSLVLKNLEGPSSARELLGKLRDTYSSNPSAQLTYILTKENKQDRIPLLEQLTQKHPTYGPGFLYLAKQFSYSESGLQTNEERRQEKAAIEKAIELEKTEKVSTYFIDKKQAEELLTWAKSLTKMNEGHLGAMLDASLKVSATTNNKITTITFTPTESIKDILYRWNKTGDFKSTGKSGITLPGSSEPLPNYYIMEALAPGKHVIEAKYIDVKGGESKIVEQAIDIQALAIQNAPLRMIDPKDGQVQYLVLWQPFEDKEYTYRYSVDNQNLDQTPPDYLGGVYLKGLSAGKHTLFVQGTFQNKKTNIAQIEFEVQ